MHTADGSVGDSIVKIPEYIKKAKEQKIRAMAITDHGSLSAIYRFYHTCKKENIKPIIGCEVYEASNSRLEKEKESYHLVLLARNQEGFKNLLSIVNDAALNGFYYKPRTDFEFLREHGKGIIALSGCIGGRIAQSIINKTDFDSYIKTYKEIFDAFYLEIQPGSFEEQTLVNNTLVDISQKLDIPLVVTNDIHYLEPENAIIHDAHVKIARKQRFDAPWVYPDTCYWMMDKYTLKKKLSYLPGDMVNQAIENTFKIADACNVTLPSETNMPRFADDADNILEKMCYERLSDIADTVTDSEKYITRLKYELSVISRLGFSGYFLMVHDFIRYAKANDIFVGPGRGSAAGSLVSYLLDISVADPLQYDLMFERFLSPHRASIPDIDLDFEAERRNELFDYAVEKYGRDHCALVSTRQMRKARGAIRDTARILNFPLEEADQIAKSIPTVYYDDAGEKTTDLSIEESVRLIPYLNRMYGQHSQLFDMASLLSDLPSNYSIHAAGIVISSKKLNEYLPLMRSKNENVDATSLILEDVETAGAVKFDFLSLAMGSVIKKTLSETNSSFDYRTNKFDDPEVWKLIGSNNTTGLFQIGTHTYKSRMPHLKPKTIEELANCLALVRGPCISSGADKKYMQIISGKEKPEYLHDVYREVTDKTCGIIIYQEQIMELAVKLDFSKEEGYDLLKAVSKKKFEIIASFEEKFLNKAKEKGIDEKTSHKMWEIIKDAGLYSFNKAHAVSYALLTYTSAYLKTYYPLHYIKNLLTNACIRDKEDEIRYLIRDCNRLGIPFLPPNINHSCWEFSVECDKIRIGFCAIKQFGIKAFAEIVSKRPFSTFEDLLSKVNKQAFNKRVVLSSIFSGALDIFGARPELYIKYMRHRNETPVTKITLQNKTEFFIDISQKALDAIFLLAPFPVLSVQEDTQHRLEREGLYLKC